MNDEKNIGLHIKFNNIMKLLKEMNDRIEKLEKRIAELEQWREIHHPHIISSNRRDKRIAELEHSAQVKIEIEAEIQQRIGKLEHTIEKLEGLYSKIGDIFIEQKAFFIKEIEKLEQKLKFHSHRLSNEIEELKKSLKSVHSYTYDVETWVENIDEALREFLSRIENSL